MGAWIRATTTAMAVLLVLSCDSANDAAGEGNPEAATTSVTVLIAQQAFVRCLPRDSDCVARLPETAAAAQPAESGSLAAGLLYLEAQQAFDEATGAEAKETLQADAGRRWIALMEVIGKEQAAALQSGAWSCSETREHVAGNIKGSVRCGPSVAVMRVVEPIDGEVLDQCGRWAGVYSAESRVGAGQETDLIPNLELHVEIGCPKGRHCTVSDPYDAVIELAAAGGPDGYGTGLDLRIRGVDVRAFGNLLLFSMPGADGESGVLFGVLFDCTAGVGLLQWGNLARYEHWPSQP